MSAKPVLWIARKLSDATEARAARDYDVRLNPEDRVFSADEIVEMSKQVDAILPRNIFQPMSQPGFLIGFESSPTIPLVSITATSRPLASAVLS